MKEKLNESTPNRSSCLDLHKRFVVGVKQAVKKVCEERDKDPATGNLPLQMGMPPFLIAAPPTLEAAFGYRDGLRFVAFFYSPRSAAVAHSDGGDDMPVSNPNDWVSSVAHPAICSELHAYPESIRGSWK